MLPSAKERKKNAPFFHLCYADLCKLRNVMPHSGAKAQSSKFILNLQGDKIKLDEWAPILEALRHDRSLHYIGFKSKHPCKKVLEEVDTEVKARGVIKRPVLLTNFIVRLLMESLAACIGQSSSVICIDLEGLPVTDYYMTILCRGLATNSSLQTLSFNRCAIGDEACKKLCCILRKLPTLIHLDLTDCDLTDESAAAIGELLKYQQLQRFSESWKQSLRYREPDIDGMPGLRRIVLNDNPGICDQGIKQLTEVLKEDIWLKAVDLQNCGVTTEGALDVLELLKVSASLEIVDLRENKEVDEILLHQIMAKLYANNVHKEGHEYHWTIPKNQVAATPSCQSLRSKPSIIMGPNVYNSANSSPSEMLRPLVQRCKSLCLNKNFQNKNWSITRLGINNTTGRQTLPKTGVTMSSSAPHQKVLHTPSEARLTQLRNTRVKLKEVTEQLELETKLRKKAESKHEELNVKVQVLENELRREQKAKQGFCLLKLETFEAILETFRKFSAFMENVKESKVVQGIEHEKMGNSRVQHPTEMRKSWSAHASNVTCHESSNGMQLAVHPSDIEKKMGDCRSEAKLNTLKDSPKRMLESILRGPPEKNFSFSEEYSREESSSSSLLSVGSTMISSVSKSSMSSKEERSPSDKSFKNGQCLSDISSKGQSQSDLSSKNHQILAGKSLTKVQQIFESLVKEKQGIGDLSKDDNSLIVRRIQAEPLRKPSVTLNLKNNMVCLSDAEYSNKFSSGESSNSLFSQSSKSSSTLHIESHNFKF